MVTVEDPLPRNSPLATSHSPLMDLIIIVSPCSLLSLAAMHAKSQLITALGRELRVG